MLRSGEFFGRPRAAWELGAFAVSITDYAHGAAIDWHEHSGPYLTFVASGGYRERLRHRSHDCAPQQIVQHPAGERHADHFQARTRCINIQIDPRWLSRWDIPLNDTRPMASPQITSTMARLRRELGGGDPLAAMAAEGLVFELMAAVTRSGRRENGSAPGWLRLVHEEVITRFREPLTLAALASTAGVHPVHLAKAFRKHFNATVGDVVRRQRVEFACARIAGGAPLVEIALEAGFADQSHLSRTFRRVTGQTPSEFRRSHCVPER